MQHWASKALTPSARAGTSGRRGAAAGGAGALDAAVGQVVWSPRHTVALAAGV